MQQLATSLAIEFGQLHIWVHGRQYPDANDVYDANWLLITAQYNSIEASVAILTTREIEGLMRDCRNVLQGVATTIDLACLEPNIQIHFKADVLGHLNGTVAITNDPNKERHEYHTELDQSYLPNILLQLEKVLEKYPVKGQ